jgi:hypothetical protein
MLQKVYIKEELSATIAAQVIEIRMLSLTALN